MSGLETPSSDTLTAYCAGTLEAATCVQVDAWLDTLDESTQAEVLTRHGIDRHQGALAPRDAAPRTWEPGAELGRGGMGTVYAARDRRLGRDVALKVLHPRRSDEPLEAFLLREAAFHREARTIADLDHPGIIPVYDIGQVDGLPAFTMKRLHGRTLGELLAAGPVTTIALVEFLRQAAATVGHAHARGVVHRDLKPDNLVIDDSGAVFVLDWGLAGRIGETDAPRAGTPAWMAPEQQTGASPDPRMDVYALGRLLAQGLEIARPPALNAVITRACACEPSRRYPDATALAEELNRWQTEGLTLALDLSPVERTWLRLRRSKQLRMSLGLGTLAALLIAGSVAWNRDQQRQLLIAQATRLGASAEIQDPQALHAAAGEARELHRQHPELPAAAAASARLEAAVALREQAAAAAAIRAELDRLVAEVRNRATWAGEWGEWSALLTKAGIPMDHPGNRPPTPLPGDGRLAEAVAYAWRAAMQHGQNLEGARLARLLAVAGPDPAWQALGRLLGNTAFRAHDPVFCHCVDSDGALASPATTSVLLALYAPEPRLVAAAERRLEQDPGAFWPLITVARAAQAAQDWTKVQRLALIASGAAPGSLRPPMLLAYAALARQDWPELAAWSTRGLAIHPDHGELLVLQAAGLARLGRTTEGQALLDRIAPGHLRYHLEHPLGHPMELGVQAALAAGLTIPPAESALGPLVPEPAKPTAP